MWIVPVIEDRFIMFSYFVDWNYAQILGLVLGVEKGLS